MGITIKAPDGRNLTLLQNQALALQNLELQIDLASPGNLKAMHLYAQEQAIDFAKPARSRATWKRIAQLIKQELKKA